jgi:hypothetical protein
MSEQSTVRESAPKTMRRPNCSAFLAAALSHVNSRVELEARREATLLRFAAAK